MKLKAIILSILTIFSSNASFSQCTRNGLDLDGIDDFVNLDLLASSLANKTNFTIEFWMNADVSLQNTSRVNLFSVNLPAPDGENEFLIIMGGSADVQEGKLIIYDQNSPGSNFDIVSPEIIGDNVCHHIAYVRDGDFGEAFIDGISIGTHPVDYNFGENHRYSIGQDWDGLMTSEYYKGHFDELRIWDFSKTQVEIQSSMDQELIGNEPGIIAYYNFNQGIPAGDNFSVDTLFDLANNHDGILNEFSLTGNTSNWILSRCLTTTACNEICDNSIDDDEDGLIDLNDPDCDCFGILELSFIENPSFEDTLCCPSMNSQMGCVANWEQASAPTTDYVNTCGFLGNSALNATPPLPFPHGQGGIGFRDGGLNAPHWKEYAGSCLKEKLIAGKKYTFNFFVGFRDNIPGNMEIDLGFFANPSCSRLPFGGGNTAAGCPLNYFGWDLLEEKHVSGNNEWVEVEFNFTPTKNYAAIVLGPGCDPNPNLELEPYFYLDGLVLTDSVLVASAEIQHFGQICDEVFSLYVDSPVEGDVQWYVDGIAIVDEVQDSIFLTIENPNGIYQAVISNANGCFLSKEFQLERPQHEFDLSISICEGETFMFGNNSLDQTGLYSETFQAHDGCDSIVYLDLIVDDFLFREFDDTICENDTYLFHDLILMESGSFTTLITNDETCDSLLTINLYVVEEAERIDIGINQTIQEGQVINIVPEYIDPSFTHFLWYESSRNIITENNVISGLRLDNSTFIFLEALDNLGCRATDSIYIRVINELRYFIPNAFSPNSDLINDVFNIYGDLSSATSLEVWIYDRWGELVYAGNYQNPDSGVIIWDGKFDNQDVEIGVYVYQITIYFEDNSHKIFRGDLTLLK